MAGEKRFGTRLFGYKKKDVYEYVEKLAKDLEEQLKIKDAELANLRNQNKFLLNQNDEMSNKLKLLETDRSAIANAIIKAEEQAKTIVEDAIKQAEVRKQELLVQTEMEANKLNEARNELKALKLNAINTIQKYESELSTLFALDGETSLSEKPLPKEEHPPKEEQCPKEDVSPREDTCLTEDVPEKESEIQSQVAAAQEKTEN